MTQRANERLWQKVLDDWIDEIIMGPLHWLGLADIEVENGKLKAFRLGQLRELYFAAPELEPLQVASYPSTMKESSPSVQVEDDFIYLDPIRASGELLDLVDSIASLQSSRLDRLEYRVDVRAVYDSFQSGRTLTQIITAWSELIQQPLPESINQQLSTWWQNYGAARLYKNATILECKDEQTLKTIRSITSLSEQPHMQLTPTVLLIPETIVETIYNELSKAGYTPKRSAKVS